MKKCETCDSPAEAERYNFCYDCWWSKDPRNNKNSSSEESATIVSDSTITYTGWTPTPYLRYKHDKFDPGANQCSIARLQQLYRRQVIHARGYLIRNEYRWQDVETVITESDEYFDVFSEK